MLNLGQSEFLKNREKMVKVTVLKLPTEVKYIKKASSNILEAVKPYNLGEDKLYDIRLSVEEAVRNAMVHGNSGRTNLSVKVKYWIKDEKLNVEVEDEGAGYDYGLLPDPTEGDNIMKGSGRGVYLIRRLMDEVKFNEAGNKIKMIKCL